MGDTRATDLPSLATPREIVNDTTNSPRDSDRTYVGVV